MTKESDSDSKPSGNDLPTQAFDGSGSPGITEAGLEETFVQGDSGLLKSDGEPLGSQQAVSDGAVMPCLEGYELLEELGRGGMGVVYRARHKKLDRPVAIKMILAGQFASPESIARFQLEAETAARLDHPGIVPIYEIGQSGQHHFFSMKLIDGRPLSALLDEYQPDQRHAAELMIQVAEAVQHAHQRGVLHRDLKPANVLIDQDGQPLLTDLGLAKQMDSESAITQTGLILGSPGFMSPEQAAGKADVTVAADVYAMGAILYWLVTGRAPVTGESAIDIVRKTIDQEPESMRSLRTDADRDLNLICLKALQKDPSERYASADELAADLKAWIAGEPLSVKPPTLLTTTRRWMQKNFRGVAVGLATGTVCGLWIGWTLLMQIAESQIETATSIYEQLQAADEPWIARAFAWIERLPAQLRSNYTRWITVVTAVAGIATIGWSKPKRGDAGVAASLTAAMLTGILAFVVSWAWAPIANNALDASKVDLQLLTDYLFLHPDDRHLAEDVLFERYPGLSDVESWKRSDVFQSKLGSDQSNSIPSGILTGLLVTFFVAAFPVFASGLLASVVWHRGHRGWAYTWRALEIGCYVTTLMFLLCRSLSSFAGAPPLLKYQLLSTVVMGAAVLLALKQQPFWIRIPFFLAVLFTFGINMEDASRVGHASWIAQGARGEEQMLSAAALLERNVAWSKDREQLVRLATLYAYLDKDDDYLRVCDRLLTHSNFYRRSVARDASRVLLLKPHLHDDMQLAHRLAKWASEQKGYQGWDYISRSFSELRLGEGLKAIDWADKAIETAIAQDAWYREMIVAIAEVLKVNAYRLLGEPEEADAAMVRAESAYDPESDVTFDAKLIFEMLREESVGAGQ